MFLVAGAARRARRTLACLVLAAASACTLDDVDYAGKSCPCPAPEWVCESDRCAPASPCALRADDVRMEWSTPHAIGWHWTPVGVLDRFGSYRVRVGIGTGPDDVVGEPALITATDNPELGLALRPHTGGDDPVQDTITEGHQPDTPYWGQLEIVDDSGCVWTSSSHTRRTTPEPPDDHLPIVIYEEELPAGSWLSPDAAVAVEGAGSFAGTHHLRWEVAVSDGENLQLGGLGFPLQVVGADLHKTAYLEAAVAMRAQSHAYYCWVKLQVAPEGTGSYATIEPVTVRGDDAYHVFEVALSGLPMEDARPELTAGDTLQKFMIGCQFELGAVLRVDSVRLRW